MSESDRIHVSIRRFIEDLFNNCYFIARVELDIPDADYQNVIKTLKEHEELLREHHLKCAFIKDDIGYKMIINRNNEDITGTKIDAMQLITHLINIGAKME